MKNQKKFFFILPSFKDYAGHEIEFIPYLSKYCIQNKFDYEFILPQNNIIKIKKKNNCLKPLVENFKILKLINTINYIIKNIIILKKILRSASKNDVIYIDTQSFLFFFSFIISMIFKKKLILLYWIRTQHNSFLKRIIFKTFHQCYKFFFKKVFVFNENDHLTKYAKQIYNINCIGIPSIHFLKTRVKKIKYKKIKILCPGVYRWEKYGKNLVDFIKNCKDTELTLSISKEFKKEIKHKIFIKINYNKKSLDKKDYIKTYNNSDIIFLPYDEVAYSNRFSGMMYEALSAKKFVFTSKNTLMAKYLIKNNLKELVINNWKKVNYKSILSIITNKNIQKKFFDAHKKYLEENNFFTFKKKINSVIN